MLAPYTCDRFISMYSFMAVVGIMRYLSKEQEWATGDFFLLWADFPRDTMFLDVLMPFYQGLECCLPNGLVTFMAQYEALRTWCTPVIFVVSNIIID